MTELSYRNTRFDVMGFYLYCAFRRWPGMIAWIIPLAIAAPSSWRIAYRPEEPLALSLVAFAVQELLVFAFVFALGVLVAAALTFLSRDPLVYAQRTLASDNSALHIQSVHGSSTLNWQSVGAVRSTARHCYIFTGALSGIIVPRRAFPSKQEWSAFREAIRSHWRSARP